MIVDLDKLLARLEQAQKENEQVRDTCKSAGRSHAESYADGSVFGFARAAVIAKELAE